MGLEDAKSGRMPTDGRDAEMQRIVHEAMDHGAAVGRRSGFGRNSVQADFDGTPMVTDLMADETAIALASVLGERNEGFIQMTYIPDAASKYEGNDQNHSEKHFEDLAMSAGRPILYNAIVVNDAYPERFRASCTGSKAAPSAASASTARALTLEVELRLHLQGLEPVGRYARVA